MTKHSAGLRTNDTDSCVESRLPTAIHGSSVQLPIIRQIEVESEHAPVLFRETSRSRSDKNAVGSHNQQRCGTYKVSNLKDDSRVKGHAFTFPQFTHDGELDATYVAMTFRARKTKLVSYLCVCTLFYLAAEIPYIVAPGWDVKDNYIPLFLRVAGTILMVLFCCLFRSRRMAEAECTARSLFIFDTGLFVLTTVVSLLLVVAEHFRQTFVEDGLVLVLVLLTTFSSVVLHLRFWYGVVQCVCTLAAYATFVFTNSTQLYPSVPYLLLMHATCLWMLHEAEVYRDLTLVSQRRIFLERQKTEKLLRNMLPDCVLTDYVDGKVGQIARVASIAFVQIDIVSQQQNVVTPPAEVIQRLHDMFKRIDGIVGLYAHKGVNKIETVANTYLLCAGLLRTQQQQQQQHHYSQHAPNMKDDDDYDVDYTAQVISVALEIMSMVSSAKRINQRTAVCVRVGISTGPVVGGIIGVQRRFFRVFGDTVNVAARMCTSATREEVLMSHAAFVAMNDIEKAQFDIAAGILIPVKGKQNMICHAVRKKKAWVPLFNKVTLARGVSLYHEKSFSQKPLPGRSFVYHKIINYSQLNRWTLVYQQVLTHSRPVFVIPLPVHKYTGAPVLSANGERENKKQRVLGGVSDVCSVQCVDVLDTIERAFQQEFVQHLVERRIKHIHPCYFVFLCGILIYYGVTKAAISSIVLCTTIALLFAIHMALLFNRCLEMHLQAISVVFFTSLYVCACLGGYFTSLHFAYWMQCLNLYSGVLLTLQYRFALPLSIVGNVAFLLTTIFTKRFSFSVIIFHIFFLGLSAGITLYFSNRTERSYRSNFVLQYAVNQEQQYIDQLLNNLLPNEVVQILKQRHQRRQSQMTKTTTTVTTPTPTTVLPDTATFEYGNHNNSSQDSSSHVPTPRRNSMRIQQPWDEVTTESIDDECPSPSLNKHGDDVSFPLRSTGVSSRFAMQFTQTTVFESDLVGYTSLVSTMTPAATLNLLNHVFSRFDELAAYHKVEKIETIGDAFMCVVLHGSPHPILDFALRINNVLCECNKDLQTTLQIRMGVATGSCFAGIIGSEISRFHLFGAAHDHAIALEQAGIPGHILVADSTEILCADCYEFALMPDMIVQNAKTHILQGKLQQQQRQQQHYEPIMDDPNVTDLMSICAPAALPSARTSAATFVTPEEFCAGRP